MRGAPGRARIAVLLGLATAGLGQAAEIKPGFVVRIRELPGEPDARAPAAPAAAATPLTEAEAAQVLRRLPPLPLDPAPASFALRPSSLTRPRAGVVVKEPFPPVAAGARPDGTTAAPLTVLRHAPEGEVPLAANVSVTFSQPMVDLAARSELEAEAVPVRLTPQPAGRWRWLGTRTLVFEPEGGRLPMATAYTVEVPAGTRAAGGHALAAPVRWSFGTPAPKLTDSWPEDAVVPVRPEALLFAAFDQRIDPAAVLAALRTRVDHGARPSLRLATAAEVAADDEVRGRAAQAGPGRWLALRAEAGLPADTRTTVAFPDGTPSAEGPRGTAEEQRFDVQTYGALRFVTAACGDRTSRCVSGLGWSLTFSNTLDADSFRPALVRVDPPLDGLAVDVSGRHLKVNGQARPRTRYTVTVAAELRDEFGQSLGQAVTSAFTPEPMARQVQALGGSFVVLDPSGPPRYTVWSGGFAKLRARIYAVTPADWPAFAKIRRDRMPAPPPGRLVADTIVRVAGSLDQLVETRIDLASALRADVGRADGGHNLVVHVEGVVPPAPSSSVVEVVGYTLPQQVRTWVQSTRIGLSAFVDDRHLLGWASALGDGAPLAGVELQLLGFPARAATDAQGLARLDLLPAGSAGLVARLGSDVAFLPAESERVGSWGIRDRPKALRWAVFDDRSLYRPGEDVKAKGWVRVVDLGLGGDLEPWGGTLRAIDYVLEDAQQVEIAKGTAPVNAYGGFELSLHLPPEANLGAADLELSADGWGADTEHHQLEIEEFRRPEYEVTATASASSLVLGGTSTVTARARYFSGGALADAPVEWTVEAWPATFSPPHRDGFAFGRWEPWWSLDRAGHEPLFMRALAGRTDGHGTERLELSFESADPPLPRTVSATASVVDVNRQRWSATAVMLVHPADVYVGLRLSRPFVERGAPFTVEAIATDLDGGAAPGRPIEMVAERLSWVRRGKESREEAVEAGRCSVVSGPEAVRCALRAGDSGEYRITATVRDAQGRASLSETRLWVAGGAGLLGRAVDEDAVTLVPGRQEYRAGETAEVLVVSPLVPAEGLLTVRRSGLVKSERFRVTQSTTTLRVPIEEGWVPNVELRVDLVGTAPRADAPGRARPALASGSVRLVVPPLSRRLAVSVAARDPTLEPGGRTTLDVALTDAAGRPVPKGEVALAVVDEAVLALIGREPLDPLPLLYDERKPGVTEKHLRSLVSLGEGTLTAEQLERLQSLGYLYAATSVSSMSASVTVMQASPSSADTIRLRADFTPLALFAGSVVTDADGRAQVPLTVPDSLTRYRVMAVAATAGTQFGAAESTLTVRLPLMARPSAPRFLNYGDRFELPVVVQNQTEAELPVEVAVRAQGLRLVEAAGRRVSVPAHGRVEVRFPMAVEHVGTARVQVAASSGARSDAAEVTLPVWTPATTEAFAVYGTLDAGAVAQPVRPPAHLVPEFGGLDVSTSSTALHALTDAVLYLVAYPYECSEQLSSRVLGVAALRDVLAAFQAPGLPPAAELEAAVARDLRRLQALQNDDGGFGFWRKDERSWPYLSIHVARALERARAKGFAVPGHLVSEAERYLQTIEEHIPRDYPLDARRLLIADALNVRHRLGDSDRQRARALVAEAGVQGLSFEALGWLLPVLAQDPASRPEADAIRQRLANGVAETGGAAHFAVSYGEAGPYLLLSSDRRADAIVLDALIDDQPQSDLIPKLVEGLLGHRTAGRWLNTQENVFILLALDRYFQAYEKVAPDFVARAWLGEQMVAEEAFRGRSSERHETRVPMAALMQGGRRDLVLAKDGPGRLYYRLGLRYAPESLRLDPAAEGFTVARRYEAVDDPADVRRDAQGAWRIRAGARVRVKLGLVADGRRAHVALVDPLPAGLEAQNPALATTARAPDDEDEDDEVSVMGALGGGGPGNEGGWWWLRQAWFDHQNLRDDRVEAFTALLFEGVYTYSYLAVATTPGTFVVPPAKAEEMYHPETFGRSGTDTVIVE